MQLVYGTLAATYLLVKGFGLIFGSKSKKVLPEPSFPEPIRNWELEKQLFVDGYVKSQLSHH